MTPRLLFVFICFLISSIFSAQASPDLPVPVLKFEEKIIEDEDTKIMCELRHMKDLEVNLTIKGNMTLSDCNQKNEERADKGTYTSKTCTVEVTKEMDQMEVICEAYFKTQSKPEKMYLQREPEFTDCPNKQVWIEGQESGFHCKATGHPIPKVTCARSPDTFKEGETYKALRNMTGNYSCIAINFDRVSKNVEVSIQYKPEVLDIKVNPPLHNDGDTVTVTCEADGEPPPTYGWVTPSSDVQFSADNTTITIMSMKNIHRGKYRCTASNKHGDHSLEQDLVLAVQPNISVIKMEPSEEVFEGDNVTLSCEAIGFPLPVLSWNYPNSEVERSPDQRKIKIWGIKKKHEGNYTCTAQNKHGTVTQSQQITLAEKGNSGHRVEMSVSTVLALLLSFGLMFCLL